ncbi:MAG: sigma-70 family RNA polymerase sigma factor [Saprospiraceae bacterium]|nr:sigma-70 family RNA polymerase sigma factor [Saprospiraceae bacterium]
MEAPLVTADYVAAILQGDPILLRQMYQKNFPAISNLIQQNGGTSDDAKDVFQDAVMVIYEKAKHPDFQLTSQFSTYIYGICRNLWGSRLQKKSFSEVTIPDDAKYKADDLPDLDYAALEQRNLYDKAFARLGKDCQKLLLLFFQKLPMEEIAKTMGFASVGYARRRKFMCKEHLTELVKSCPEYQELRNG